MRLQKWIAQAGLASRRKAEEMILEGRVKLNGKVIAELGTKADPARDKVTVDGKPVLLDMQEKIYVMLHKPEGVITSSADQFKRETVVDLLPADMTARLYPVGRLDYDTSGLIFLTNDGDFTLKLTHPKYKISKTYIAHVKGTPRESALIKLREGVKIDGKRTSPCEVEIIPNKTQATNAKLLITIREGRNRQLRKMCEAIEHHVISLKRVEVGGVKLGDLEKGEWRNLNEQELRALKALTRD